MNKIDRVAESVFGLSGSSVDSNKFYSILLDARAATVSESMYDIAEKLLTGEKGNAKIALDQLWGLKKNALNDSNGGTIELLINYYQNKMDILRNKEEHIKKISKDSRSLLEDKRKKDEEIATVKQQIGDCTKELEALNIKLEKLSIKEQELTLIEGQLKKELHFNENEIINGLYEIILSQQEQNDRFQLDEILKPAEQGFNLSAETEAGEAVETNEVEAPAGVGSSNETEETDTDIFVNIGDAVRDSEPEIEFEKPLFKIEKQIEIPVYPKSVVKTTGGRVIGEYYYDNTLIKDKRHYIFNSNYFTEQLGNGTKILKQKFDQIVYSEMVQMIQDAHKRVSESDKLHFEISTNEILNEKTLKQLWLDVKKRSFDEVERFFSRLNAKIEALGTNYNSMLKEQMDRYSK